MLCTTRAARDHRAEQPDSEQPWEPRQQDGQRVFTSRQRRVWRSACASESSGHDRPAGQSQQEGPFDGLHPKHSNRTELDGVFPNEVWPIQVELVLQRAARREDKTERLKREQGARDAVLSLYADRFAHHLGGLPRTQGRR